MKPILVKIFTPILAIGGISGIVAIGANASEQKWNQLCDGIEVTETCKDEDGIKYKKYLYHEEVAEQKETIHHDEVPAVTHEVYHPAEYGYRQVIDGCVRTTISYKRGTCALSQCWDGEYSGSSGWGTCNYHGGVKRGGGPWYTYHEEKYVIKQAWTEVVVDKEAIPAWDEEETIVPYQEAYYEKVRA